MPDAVEIKREQIDRRLEELAPIIEEYHVLMEAKAKIDGLDRRGHAPVQPLSTRSTAGAQGRGKGRPTGSGKRTVQALEILQEAYPEGLDMDTLAARMGIVKNYLYRVLPQLEQLGEVRKEGKVWFWSGVGAPGSVEEDEDEDE